MAMAMQQTCALSLLHQPHHVSGNYGEQFNVLCRSVDLKLSYKSINYKTNVAGDLKMSNGRSRSFKVVLASLGKSADGTEVKTIGVPAGGRSREELKKLVMRAVTNTNRGKCMLDENEGHYFVTVTKTATDEQRQYIFSLVQELEVQNPTSNPINSPLLSGRWALLYTAPIDETTSDKYAGTEEGPFLSRVKPVSLGSVQQSRSFQVIDIENGAAENIAEFTVFKVDGSLTIYGQVMKASPSEIGAVRVDVTFKSFVVKVGTVQFPSVPLSWISPKGWIDTTYLDDNFRVGRGDKGSIFVAVRAKQL